VLSCSEMEGSLPRLIANGVGIFLTVFLVHICQVLVYITFVWWNRALNTRYQTILQRIYVHFTDKTIGSSEIVVTGDPVDPTETAILIANHQMDVDWWYVWCFTKKYERQGNFKIALKKELFYIPIFGLGIFFSGFSLSITKVGKR